VGLDQRLWEGYRGGSAGHDRGESAVMVVSGVLVCGSRRSSVMIAGSAQKAARSDRICTETVINAHGH
jgi:hypothetical protein